MKRLILFSVIFLSLISLTSADMIPLSFGWNQFSIIAENESTVSSTDNMNATLNRGYNLIGYSSYKNFSHSNVNYTYENGAVLTMQQAVDSNTAREQYSHWTNLTATSKGYELIPISDNLLRTYQAYWIYWNDTSPVNVTFNGVGGGLLGRAYPFNNLTFTNGTAELNVTEALSNGWVGVPGQNINTLIRYWDNGGFSTLSGSSSLSPWRGYVVWSRKDNISICVWQNCSFGATGGGGEVVSDGEGGFGYQDYSLPALDEDDDFGFNADINNSFGIGNNQENTTFGYNNIYIPSLSSILIWRLRW